MIGMGLIKRADQLGAVGITVTNDGTKTTFLGKSGDYNRIGDAGTTGHSLASEDDLMVTGDFEVGGVSHFNSYVNWYADVSYSGTLDISATGMRMLDDKIFDIGTGRDAKMLYETADTDANALVLALPDGDAINVPVFVIGDQSVLNVDLTWFNGVTEPQIAIVDDDGDSAVGLGFNGDDDARIILKGSAALTLPAFTMGGNLLGGNNDLGTQASPVGSIIAENNAGIYFLDSGGTQRLSILLDGTNKFSIRNIAGGSIELYTDNSSGAGNPVTRLTMTGSVDLSAVTWASIAAYTIGCTSFGVLGVAAQAQQAHIVNANGQLADITTKFNTLLADLEGFGFLANA